MIMCHVSLSTHISFSSRQPLNKVYMSKQSLEENGNLFLTDLHKPGAGQTEPTAYSLLPVR